VDLEDFVEGGRPEDAIELVAGQDKGESAVDETRRFASADKDAQSGAVAELDFVMSTISRHWSTIRAWIASRRTVALESSSSLHRR